VSRLAADAFWRTAALDLRLRQEPLERDYRVAGRLLDAAQTLAPDDGAIARERVEAWFQVGENDRVIAACRDILRLDPKDTVAQLRLITAQIARQQTAEARVELYERFLGPSGAALDPAVRSRLALDAGLLHRERGENQAFLDRLSLALSLDPTNKEAAALAQTIYANERGDAAGRLELLSNLLFADPLDPSVHQSMAILLGEAGAYSQGARFYISAVALMYAAKVSPPTQVGVDQLVLRWHSEGPKSVVDELSTAILTQRDFARRTIEQLDRQGIPSTGVTPPDELRLPIALEQLRLLAADACGDLKTRYESARDLERSVGKVLTTLQAQGSAGMIGLDSATDAAATSIAELLVVTSITNEQSDELKAAMDAFLTREDVDVLYREQLTPWVDLRDGKFADAETKFLSQPPDSPTVMLGLAMCRAATGQEDEARKLYQELSTRGRMSVMGAWSRSRLLGPTGSWGDEQTEEARACAAIGQGVPKWVDDMVREPRSFISLSAELTNRDGRNALRIVLRNLSPLPLAVGPDSPLNSRMLASPKMEVSLESWSLRTLPEVLDTDRRIRLLQGEAVEVDVWPDLGYSGWLAETNCIRAVRTRWGVLQGFVAGQTQTYEPGPMCLTTQTDQVTIPPVRANATVDELVQWISSAGGQSGADDRDVREASVRLRAAALLSPERGGSSTEEVARLAAAMAARYPALSPSARIIVIAHTPHARQHPAMDVLDRVIEQERDPLVLPIALVTRCLDGSSPLLAAARDSGNASTRDIAAQFDLRITDGDPLYAQVGPGLESMAGPGAAVSGAASSTAGAGGP
jgi:tetratricopeptide (TPR) repeat protein